MTGLPDGQKIHDRFSRLDTIPACDRQTDRQVDRQTRCRSKDRAMLCVARVKIEIVEFDFVAGV